MGTDMDCTGLEQLANAASVQLPFEAVKQIIANLLTPADAASALKALDRFFDDEGIAETVDLCILSRSDTDCSFFDAHEALAPLRKRAVRRRFSYICRYLAKGGSILASTTMGDIFQAMEDSTSSGSTLSPRPIIKGAIDNAENKAETAAGQSPPQAQAQAQLQPQPQPQPQPLEPSTPPPAVVVAAAHAANSACGVPTPSRAFTAIESNDKTYDRVEVEVGHSSPPPPPHQPQPQPQPQPLEPKTPFAAAISAGSDELSSWLSSKHQRKRLPYQLLRQLCEDIEHNGGIAAFDGEKTHKLASLLNNRTYLYGTRGHKIRAVIQKKVHAWKRCYREGKYAEKVLCMYQVKSAKILAAEARRKQHE